MPFHGAGKEFYALAWVMAGASRAIAQTLQQIPDTSTAAVVIPDVPGLPPSRMYEVGPLLYPVARGQCIHGSSKCTRKGQGLGGKRWICKVKK